MFAQILGETTCGIDGVQILVEVDVSNGLPSYDLVGLPAMAVRESKERVKAALRNSDYPFPMTRITVNLAPADLRKEGSGLDLPIAIGLMTCGRILEPEKLESKVFIGELSLDGRIRKVSGVLSMIMDAKKCGAQEVYIPQANAAEGKLIHGIDVYTVATLKELVEHLKGKNTLTPLPKENILQNNNRIYHVDFAEVKGQLVARRALEIAAAGGHSILMVGSPGCGKTMLARRLVTILPPMTEAEALEVTKIYSIVGLLPQADSVMLERPFRSPHHSISGSALLGGGSTPRPGEVTLAHNGVLFLDELPEFSRESLEVLRQPLEDGQITVSRAAGSATYPSHFQLVAAMNPCKCGYYGHPTRACTCSPSAVRQYRSRVSGPLLDRIDLCVEMDPIAFDELHTAAPSESSAELRKQVLAARAIQAKRYAAPGFKGVHCNAQLNAGQVRRICRMTPGAEQLLRSSYDALGLSARAHDRILRVARTVADLAGKTMMVQSTTKPEEIFLAGTDPRIPQFGELLSAEDRSVQYAMLNCGYVDAIAAHEAAILRYMQDCNANFRILEEPLLVTGIGVAFALNDTRGLDEKLTETFAAMRADGTMKQIVGKYLPDPEKYLEVDALEP